MPAGLVIPPRLLEHLAANGGVLGIAYNDKLFKDPWTVAYHFGREAEDSPMAGGAAYGAADSASEALGEVLNDMGMAGVRAEGPL